jgi:diguanylate cyclase (GGDEF)-like protein
MGIRLGSDRSPDAPSLSRYLPAGSGWLAAGCAAVLAVMALVLRLRVGGETGRLYVDDLGELLAAVAATVSCARAARATSGRMRLSWRWLSVATGAWATGEAIWSYYELVAGTATPFPSLADAGFLLYPVAAAVSICCFPFVQGASVRSRWMLDGAIVVCALLAVSWATSLGAITRSGQDSRFALAVSMAYPIGDILILTLALIALCRPSSHRPQLTLLAAAMAAMAVSDSAFSYLNAVDRFSSGHLVDLGWVASFLILVVLGSIGASQPEQSAEADGDRGTAGAPATMWPYLPLLSAGAVLGWQRWRGDRVEALEATAIVVALVLTMVRQFMTVRENRVLLDIVAAREEQLHNQAFHDALTGLANRALFMNRVHHALELRRRDYRELAIVFCDLDDFKNVNDSLGHRAGDELLGAVAQRLQGVLRPGDTLARLGGDEFALLLEDSIEPTVAASRIVGSLREPFEVSGHQIAVRASVGVTELAGPGPDISAEELLAQADVAMYSAKRAGKDGLARYLPQLAAVPPSTADRPSTGAVAETFGSRP